MHARDSPLDQHASRSWASAHFRLRSAARGPSAHGLTLPTSMAMRPARDHASAGTRSHAMPRSSSPPTSSGLRAQLRSPMTGARPRATSCPLPTTGLSSHAGLRLPTSASTPACAVAPADTRPRAMSRSPSPSGSGPRVSLPPAALSTPARDRSTSTITATRTAREPARSSQLAASRSSPADQSERFVLLNLY